MLHHGLFVLLYQKVSRMKGQRTKTICIVQHSISNGANGDHRKRLVNMKRLTGYCLIFLGRFYKFNLSLANSQNLIKATANVILLSQI